MRYTNIDALVLHVRPYRESSALVDLYTKQHGKVHAVMRGVRGNKAAKQGSGAQPFNRAVVSLSGRGQLLTVTQFEAMQHFMLAGKTLHAGLYLLEVISKRLLKKMDYLTSF